MTNPASPHRPLRIGLLTAGGDCPGLNAAIRAVVARVTASGSAVIGIRSGWEGLINGETIPLERDDVRGIVARGGTILGTSRMDPYVHGKGAESVRETMAAARIDCLLVIGGDGSLRTAARLSSEGLPVVGIPKSIDNDIGGTDVSLGFHTSVQIVTDAIDRLTSTAESHNRIMVIEVMGRTTGWIATYAGMAGGAESILIPESPYDLKDLGDRLTQRHRTGHDYSIVVVAEGVEPPPGYELPISVDAFGFSRLGGVGSLIARELERLTDFESRVTTLGYLQRGGTPTAFDRVLATRFGVRAAEVAMSGSDGLMVALNGDRVVEVDLDAACRDVRRVPLDLYSQAGWFFA